MTRRGNREGAAWAARLRSDGIDAGLADPLAEYLALLSRWGGAVDLFGGADPGGLLVGLVREALAALPWVAEAGSLVDVGSGNGFPVVPLLLARPSVRGVLLEPRERRWAFLKEVVRELGLTADVRRERVGEHAGSGYVTGTVRGVAPEVWLPEAARLVGEGGTWLCWTSAARAATLSGEVPDGRVLPFALAAPARGVLAVWRRCST